ncbi:uncharacterized protein LOC100377404 [Saccoglossus kowalevskii]|uniref:Uncharacterized protein LOC100377404 n=1 Tax=Saccoglossus kowalevskii TaxID=10224 RepID=A0ABM0H1T7_SACKO|nr:PREDICTED: uncharacterized protein LOC100377404 [Saccoglossus kowalevskii]
MCEEEKRVDARDSVVERGKMNKTRNQSSLTNLPPLVNEPRKSLDILNGDSERDCVEPLASSPSLCRRRRLLRYVSAPDTLLDAEGKAAKTSSESSSIRSIENSSRLLRRLLKQTAPQSQDEQPPSPRIPKKHFYDYRSTTSSETSPLVPRKIVCGSYDSTGLSPVPSPRVSRRGISTPNQNLESFRRITPVRASRTFCMRSAHNANANGSSVIDMHELNNKLTSCGMNEQAVNSPYVCNHVTSGNIRYRNEALNGEDFDKIPTNSSEEETSAVKEEHLESKSNICETLDDNCVNALETHEEHKQYDKLSDTRILNWLSDIEKEMHHGAGEYGVRLPTINEFAYNHVTSERE